MSVHHLRFRIDPQAVGNAVDVVEVGNDLDRVQDVPVGKTLGAQSLQVFFLRLGRRAGELFRELGQCSLTRRKRRLTIVALQLLGQFGVSGLATEILSVSLDSIEAAVHGRDNRGQQFSFSAREARRGMHRGQIEPHRSVQRLGVQALHLEDVEDLPGSPDRPIVFGLQVARGVSRLDHFDPGHPLFLPHLCRFFGGRSFLSKLAMIT